MGRNNIKSVELSLRIMQHLQTEDGATIEDLINTFDITQSTAYRHLKTLEEHGYTVKEGGEYYVGLQVLDMAHYAVNRKPVYDLAEDITAVLADTTGDRAVFVTDENGRGIVMATEVGEHGIFADINVGQRLPLHASAVGKVMLADYPRGRIETMLDRHGLPELTGNTITDRDALYGKLDEINEQGYAVNYGERIDDVRAVAVAVKDGGGTPLGALSVSAPARRLSEDRIRAEIAEELLSAAAELELRNRYAETS